MPYQFKTKLEFNGEARRFLESGDACAQIGGGTFAKMGSAGVPSDLAGHVRTLALLDHGDAFGGNGTSGMWRTACSYDAATLAPVETYQYGVCDGLIEGCGRMGALRAVSERSVEIDRLCVEVSRDAARAAWEAAKGLSSPEADRAEVFGSCERHRLVTRFALEQWYLERRTLERDFSEDLEAPGVYGADRLRAVYCRDPLIRSLAAKAGEKLRPTRLRLFEAEWFELVSAVGCEVVRDCARNAAILDALAGCGAKSVRAVFEEGGALVEHPIRVERMRRVARNGSDLDFSKWWFTPMLKSDPDPTAFRGLKFRGKWIYRADAGARGLPAGEGAA